VVIIGSFAVLGYFGGELDRQAPPIPERVVTSETTAQIEQFALEVQGRLGRCVRNLRRLVQGIGLIPFGQADTDYAKQFVRHAILEESDPPLLASEMEVILHREEILELDHGAPHRGRLAAPDLSAELVNPLCGDHIRLELALGPDSRIGAVKLDGQGCVISQVAASLLAAHHKGMPAEPARRLPAGEALGLLGIPLSTMRVKCGPLAWRALQRAIPATAGSAADGSSTDPPIPRGLGHHHGRQ
jgi:nitrogen fixation NifU-like protein